MKTPVPEILNEAMIEVTGFIPEAAAKDNSPLGKRIFMVAVALLVNDLIYHFTEIASMFDVKYSVVYSKYRQSETKLMYDHQAITMYDECKKFIENKSRSPKRNTGGDVRGGRVVRSFLREEAILKHSIA